MSTRREDLSQLVLECGATQAQPVVAALLKAMAQCSFSVSALRSAEETTLEYERFEGTIRSAAEGLQSGEFASLEFSRSDGTSPRGFVFRPRFCDSALTLWHGLIDGVEKSTYLEVKTIPGLRFASLSLEEGLDLEGIEDINDRSFPWNHWRLIEASVAGDENGSESGDG